MTSRLGRSAALPHFPPLLLNICSLETTRIPIAFIADRATSSRHEQALRVTSSRYVLCCQAHREGHLVLGELLPRDNKDKPGGQGLPGLLGLTATGPFSHLATRPPSDSTIDHLESKPPGLSATRFSASRPQVCV